MAILACAGVAAAAPFRPPPKYLNGQADQAEGRQAMLEFRATALAADYWMAFELRVMPHRGEERTLHGQLFGHRGQKGPVTRLSLKTVPEPRWLLPSSPQECAWQLPVPTGTVVALSAVEALRPIAGTDLSVFDLQMPFLHWEDYVFEGVAKVRSRPAYSFLLYPPAELAAQQPDLTGVRVALDTQFHALVQAEFLGAKGEPVKTITVLDLKKAGDQWLVKSIDLKNHQTRDKTRFTVTSVALNLSFPPEAFTAQGLAAEPPSLDGAKIDTF